MAPSCSARPKGSNRQTLLGLEDCLSEVTPKRGVVRELLLKLSVSVVGLEVRIVCLPPPAARGG